MNDLNKARLELETVLGEDGTKQYFDNLKLWFKVRISKEEFDTNARRLLPARQLQLHNAFLLALLNKCHLGDTVMEDGGSTAPHLRNKVNAIKNQTRTAGRKRKKRPPSPFMHRYEPVDPCAWVASPTRATPPPESAAAPPPEEGPPLVERRRLLPDRRLMHGRMYLAAWQAGLDGVADTAVDVVMLAVQQCLKNVLTAVLSRKSGYRLRGGRLMHGIGSEAPNPWLRNAAVLHQLDSEPPSEPSEEVAEDAERRLVQRLACGEQRAAPRRDCSLWHVWDALQVHGGVLPCHLLQSQLQERVAARLYHPSGEELEQEQIAAQLTSLRTRLAEGSLVA